MALKARKPKFAVCVASSGADDLQVRKLYRILPDASAAKEGYVRVVDDSGEDYLYPATRFVSVQLPASVERKLLARTSTTV